LPVWTGIVRSCASVAAGVRQQQADVRVVGEERGGALGAIGSPMTRTAPADA
jgi:hypothetical protein